MSTHTQSLKHTARQPGARQAGALISPASANDLVGRFQECLRQGGDEASLRAFLDSLDARERARLAAQLIVEKMVANGRLIVVRGERPFRIFAAGEPAS